MKSSDLYQKVLLICETVRREGGRALLVGGCVRDELMGIAPKDYDVEVYGIEPEKLRRILNDLFGDVDIVGASFSVYKVSKDLDVSIPRRERKVSRGHRGFIVEGDPFMSFHEACSRRDFTVNAILKDPLTGEIIDPFNGQADIKAKLLRHVSEKTFPEDSLRVLRACQFAARLEFDIYDETVELCRRIDVTDLPKERVWGEIEKILLKAGRPSVGLSWMRDLNVNRQLFPELEALVNVPQEPEWHPEGDVWTHTLMVVDEARKLIDDLDYPRKVTIMLAALCHDFGKPETTAYIDGRWRSIEHAEKGVPIAEKFLDKLGIFTIDGFPVREQVLQIVRYHLKPGEFYKSREIIGDGAFRRLARKVELELLYRVARADSLGRNPDWLPPERRFTAEAQEWFINKARALQVEIEPPKPILMGRHLIALGLKPSPLFGEILESVYQKQLDGEIKTLDEAINEARRLIEKLEKVD